MNPLNYASVAASKRLADAGIKLDTDYSWFNNPFQCNPKDNWKLISREEYQRAFTFCISYPAPSMAEIWRELPEKTLIRRIRNDTWTWIDKEEGSTQHNTNPADALIDLLIWVKKKGEK
jgi:hypothetical protein